MRGSSHVPNVFLRIDVDSCVFRGANFVVLKFEKLCLGVHHKRQPLHDKINPKDCQVLSLGDLGFFQFFRVVSSDYGKPRLWWY